MSLDITMTLDEAIQHCYEKARGCDACANEHLQLALWLEELKLLRKFIYADDIFIDEDDNDEE